MSIIRDIKQPILTNPMLSAKVRSILSRLLDSIDGDLDDNEYDLAMIEGSTTGDLLAEYNQALIDESPVDDFVEDETEEEEDTFKKADVLDDFNDEDREG